MARTKKTPTEPKTGKRARRASSAAYRPQELALLDKYPTVTLVPGTYGPHPDFGHKMTVVCICPCGTEQTRATSDIFHTHGHCTACRAEQKKAARKAKRAAVAA